MFNTVELKSQRKTLKTARKSLANSVVERDLSPEEQAEFDSLTAQIEALTKRIEVLESVQDQDDEENADVDQDREDQGDPEIEASKKRSHSPKHLDFNLSTSKTRKDSGKYSIQRALQMALSGKGLTGIEGERNQESAIQRGRPASGFWMPLDAPLGGKHRVVRRDLTTTTGAGAINYITADNYIDLLRSKMVLADLGVQLRTGLRGIERFPRLNAAAQFSWIGEGVNGTPSNESFDLVTFTPHTASCVVNISRKFVYESSFDAQTAVEADMAQVMARGVDIAGLAGDPTVQAASPIGIIKNPSVPNYTVSADTGNGGYMGYGDAIAMQQIVAEANASGERNGWCMRPALKGKLSFTPMVLPGTGGTAYPEFVYKSDNTIAGDPVLTTTEIPNNLTKGTGTCQAAIYGNWADAAVGLWSEVDVLVNPYTYATSGALQIVMLQEVDFEVMHAQSFVVATDILAS